MAYVNATISRLVTKDDMETGEEVTAFDNSITLDEAKAGDSFFFDSTDTASLIQCYLETKGLALAHLALEGQEATFHEETGNYRTWICRMGLFIPTDGSTI